MSSPATNVPAWRRSTLAIAVVGSLLMWAALPPLALGWLGWIAPVPWLLLVRMERLPGRRPYRELYLAGLIFWLLSIHWLRLPHPATYLGWLALSAYLAFYLPVFVGLSRVAVHRLAAPLWLAAPVVWTGLELARAHLLTGFLMGSLAHTQVKWTALIQISDVVGEYGVDFVVMLVAACVAETWRIVRPNPQSAIRNPQSNFLRLVYSVVPAVMVLAATLGYGHLRLSQARELEAKPHPPGPRVALIQGNSLPEWKFDLSRERSIMDEYISLSERAIAKAREIGDGRAIDLIVWPETMYRNPLREFDPGFTLPTGATRTADELTAEDRQQLTALSAHFGTALLLGIDRLHLVVDDKSTTKAPTIRAYNSAVLVGPDGKIAGTYDKMHRVMFGEYIPFAKWLPFLYKFTPLTGGIVAGAEPVALWLRATYCFSPNICYETAIPHVIRRHVATLERRREYPVALVNLTNDAWYWGSSELDMHLACDVFRAVETRVPLLVAANGGISAWIDRLGRIRAQSPKQQPDVIIADVEPGVLPSWYVRFGDWFAGLCLAACVWLAIVEWRARRISPVRPPTSDL